MKSSILIPEKIKVGFQNRDDTYTKKLGYVIYNDGKTWRKETSWKSWRNDKIKAEEFKNEPTEGFVLNKKAGGYSSGWNHRQTYCRVYDPRGFEFEINIPNLLYILENATSSKGKGLEGKFIYGWEGKDLVLVPEEAPEYKEMMEFTNMQSLTVKKADLVPGNMYITASGDTVTYMDEAKYYDYLGVTDGKKKLWFCTYEEGKTSYFDSYSISCLRKFIGTNPNFATLFNKMEQNNHYKPKKAAKIYCYKKLTSEQVIKKYQTSERQYFYNQKPFFIPLKTKGSYKETYIVYGSDYVTGKYRQTYYLSTSYYSSRRERDNNKITRYEKLEDLVKNHEFYERYEETEK